MQGVDASANPETGVVEDVAGSSSAATLPVLQHLLLLSRFVGMVEMLRLMP